MSPTSKHTDNDLKQMLWIILLMSAACFQAALWYKIDVLKLEVKYLEEKVNGFENATYPATSTKEPYIQD